MVASIFQKSPFPTSPDTRRARTVCAPLSQCPSCLTSVCVSRQANASRARSGRTAKQSTWKKTSSKSFSSCFGKRAGSVPLPTGPPDATESDVEMTDVPQPLLMASQLELMAIAWDGEGRAI